MELVKRDEEAEEAKAGEMESSLENGTYEFSLREKWHRSRYAKCFNKKIEDKIEACKQKRIRKAAGAGIRLDILTSGIEK